MRPGLICALLLLGALTAQASRHHHYQEEPETVPFMVGGLVFQVPAAWQPMLKTGAARAGQWLIKQPPGVEDEGAQAVVFYFGPGVGGTVKENFDGWASGLQDDSGDSVKATPTMRKAGGFNITQAVMFGDYQQAVPAPGVPPVTKPDWGLIGVTVEGPQGTIFWRVTGPSALIIALEPAVTQMIDSLKIPPAPAAPKP
jgi:hypothetical protein